MLGGVCNDWERECLWCGKGDESLLSDVSKLSELLCSQIFGCLVQEATENDHDDR